MQTVYRKSLALNIAVVYCMQNSEQFTERKSVFVDLPNLFSCLKSNPAEEVINIF